MIPAASSRARSFAPITTQLGALLRLAVPMVVSRAGLAGMSLADGLMVAQYDPAQLALLGLAEGTIGRLLDVLGALLLAGIVLAARALASGTPAEAGAVWRRAMAAALLCGLVAMAIGLAAPWWLGRFGVAAPLATAAGHVVAVLAAGFPPALMAVATAVFLEAIGHARFVAVAVIIANLLNIGLNWLLIGGSFQLGAAGSALSTSLVRLALALALVAYALLLPERDRLGLRNPPTWWRGGQAQRRLGYGAAGTAAVMNAMGLCLTLFAGWLGTITLATMTALFSPLAVGALLALGIADATALRVAAAPRGGLTPGLLGLVLASLALAAAFGPVLLAPQILAGWYAPPGALRDTLSALLPLALLVLLFDAAGFVAAAALRGLGYVAWPTGIQFAIAALLVPLAWWLAIAQNRGAAGLVQAILLTSVLRALLLWGRFAQRAGARP